MMRARRLAPLTLAAALALACSSATPTGHPGVDRVGNYVLRYSGPEIEMVIGYRYSALNLGAQWMFLDVAVTGASTSAVEISRDRIFLSTPAGNTVPLATQEEFADSYASLRGKIRQANIMSDPLDYFPRGRLPCAMQFFTAPGFGVSYSDATVDDRRVCTGRFYFYVDDGIQAGTYQLTIDLPESTPRIPFVVGEH